MASTGNGGFSTFLPESVEVTSITAVPSGYVISMSDGSILGPDEYLQMHGANLEYAVDGTWLQTRQDGGLVSQTGPRIRVEAWAVPGGAKEQANNEGKPVVLTVIPVERLSNDDPDKPYTTAKFQTEIFEQLGTAVVLTNLVEQFAKVEAFEMHVRLVQYSAVAFIGHAVPGAVDTSYKDVSIGFNLSDRPVIKLGIDPGMTPFSYVPWDSVPTNADVVFVGQCWAGETLISLWQPVDLENAGRALIVLQADPPGLASVDVAPLGDVPLGFATSVWRKILFQLSTRNRVLRRKPNVWEAVHIVQNDESVKNFTYKGAKFKIKVVGDGNATLR